MTPVAKACEIIDGYVRCGEGLRRRGDLGPAGGSQGDLERRSQHLLRGDWCEGDPIDLVIGLSALWLHAAEDHVRAVGRLLQPPQLHVSPHTALRGAIEAGSRAWWMFDPDANGRTRVARAMNERLYGIREQGKHGEGAKAHERTLTATIVNCAKSHGFKVIGGADEPWIEQGREANTALAGKLLDAAGSAGFGTRTYRYHTAVAHGVTTGLAALLVMDPAVGPDAGRFELSDAEALRVATTTCLVYETVTNRVFQYLGWDAALWGSWTHHAHLQLIDAGRELGIEL